MGGHDAVKLRHDRLTDPASRFHLHEDRCSRNRFVPDSDLRRLV